MNFKKLYMYHAYVPSDKFSTQNDNILNSKYRYFINLSGGPSIVDPRYTIVYVDKGDVLGYMSVILEINMRRGSFPNHTFIKFFESNNTGCKRYELLSEVLNECRKRAKKKLQRSRLSR